MEDDDTCQHETDEMISIHLEIWNAIKQKVVPLTHLSCVY
jgi:hypothetical protein